MLANTADFSGTPATSDVIDIEGAADGNEATTFVYTLTAKKAGSQVFTISGKANNLDVSATYTVTVVAASLTTAKGAAEAAPDFMIKSVAFDDSDGVVSAGTPVKATVTVENGSDSTKVRLTVPTTGLSIVDPRGGRRPSHTSLLTNSTWSLSERQQVSTRLPSWLTSTATLRPPGTTRPRRPRR